MTKQRDEGNTLILVQIDPRFVADVSEEDLQRAAVTTMRLSATGESVEPASPVEVSLVIVDDETMQQLNRDYRGVDSTTDVLSFGGEAVEFVSATEEAASYLGDVIVSFPRARAQAAAAGHTVGAEMMLLVVHGVLHLLGYDHSDAVQKETMWRQQSEILHSLGLESVLPTEND